MCSVVATTTISAASQFTEIASCSTFNGAITIIEPVDGGSIVLDGLEVINGDFNVNDTSSLTQLSAPTLRTITGELLIQSTTGLETVRLPVATEIGGIFIQSTDASLKAVGLPLLTTTSYVGLLTTEFEDVLSFSNMTSMPQGFNIEKNPLLTNITLFVSSTGGASYISGNGNNTAQVNLPSLVTVDMMSISGCSSFSAPLLQSGGLQFTNNSFTTLSLAEYLQSTQFNVQNNDQLTMLSAPVFQTALLPSFPYEESVVIQITNNSNLNTIDFHSLAQVDGAIVDGTFQSIAFPSLKSMTAEFSIFSDQNISSSCAALDALFTENVIKGSFTCSYPGSDTNSPSNHNDNATVIGGSVGGVVAFFMILAALIIGFVFWRLRKRSARAGRGGIELQESSQDSPEAPPQYGDLYRERNAG